MELKSEYFACKTFICATDRFIYRSKATMRVPYYYKAEQMHRIVIIEDNWYVCFDINMLSVLTCITFKQHGQNKQSYEIDTINDKQKRKLAGWIMLANLLLYRLLE